MSVGTHDVTIIVIFSAKAVTTNVSKVSNINGIKQMLVSKVFELGRSPGLVVMG